jgi:hypothetical protein
LGLRRRRQGQQRWPSTHSSRSCQPVANVITPFSMEQHTVGTIAGKQLS